MTTINVTLSEDRTAFVTAQAAREGYASADEYVLSLVREAQRRQAKRELEAKFREAIESGPAEPMTREDWDDLKREVWEQHRQEQANRGRRRDPAAGGAG